MVGIIVVILSFNAIATREISTLEIDELMVVGIMMDIE